MNDAEFVEEFAARLNLFLQADETRANAALLTSLAHAGFANVGHLLGQLCFPRGFSPGSEVGRTVKFLAPIIENHRIAQFKALTGEELQQQQQELAKQSNANSQE